MRLGRAVVSGRSMRPTLVEGDRLLVLVGAAPRPGDLVLVRLPGQRSLDPLAVKRAWRRDGAGWWVERDNPVEGVDSWTVGAVPDRDVAAVVLARYRPRPRWLRPPARRRGPGGGM